MRTIIDSHKVKGTNPKDHYTIDRWSDGTLSCSCKGFQFRRNCRHCDLVDSIVWNKPTEGRDDIPPN